MTVHRSRITASHAHQLPRTFCRHYKLIFITTGIWAWGLQPPSRAKHFFLAGQQLKVKKIILLYFSMKKMEFITSNETSARNLGFFN